MEAPWLNQLEDRVRQAVKEMQRLRTENQELRSQLEGAGKVTAEDSEWQAERTEVRRRVEELATRLEELLDA